MLKLFCLTPWCLLPPPTHSSASTLSYVASPRYCGRKSPTCSSLLEFSSSLELSSFSSGSGSPTPSKMSSHPGLVLGEGSKSSGGYVGQSEGILRLVVVIISGYLFWWFGFERWIVSGVLESYSWARNRGGSGHLYRQQTAGLRGRCAFDGGEDNGIYALSIAT